MLGGLDGQGGWTECRSMSCGECIKIDRGSEYRVFGSQITTLFILEICNSCLNCGFSIKLCDSQLR